MEKLTQQRSQTQQAIKMALKWTDLEYANHVFETGISYLREYLREDEFVDVILASPIFWNWWKMQWHLRDVEFMRSVRFSHDRSLLLELYGYLNDPKELAEGMQLHAVILEDTYPRMIDRVVEMERRKKVLSGKN